MGWATGSRWLKATLVNELLRGMEWGTEEGLGSVKGDRGKRVFITNLQEQHPELLEELGMPPGWEY